MTALAALVVLSAVAACGPGPTATIPPSTPPVTPAPTEKSEPAPAAVTPTQPPTPASSPAPTLLPTPFPTPLPTSLPASTPAVTPSPTAEIQPTPTPAPSPLQLLLSGLPWTTGEVDDFERRAISALTALAELDLEQARFLAGAGWVSDGITGGITGGSAGDEASVIEIFAEISAADVELGTALTRLDWLTDPSVTAQVKIGWLEGFLDLSPFPNAARTIAAWPWVLGAPTDFGRRVQEDLAFIATTNSALLDRVVGLPWLQDEITPGESQTLDRLAKLDLAAAVKLLELDWFSSELKDGESSAVAAISRISAGDPALASTVLDIDWVRDGLNSAEGEAISLLADMEGVIAEAVLTVPWFADGVAAGHEINVLDAMTSFNGDSLSLAAQITGMPFFRDSAERHDESAVKALRTLSENPEDWALLTKQPWYKDGIDDDEAVLLTVLPGQAKTVPTDYQSLVNNRFYIEAATVPLPLAGEIDVYLLRFLEQAVESATMAHVRMALPIIEEFMGIPSPVDEIIMLFSTNIDAGGLNYGTHFTLDLSRDIGLPQLETGGIVHEISHFYVVSESAWFGEGAANYLSTLVANELYGQPVGSRSLLSNCPGDVSSITEIAAAYPGFYPSPIEYRFCYHSYGEKIVRDTENVMGAGPFKAAWQEIFRRGVEGGIRFTDAEIYQIFIGHAPADKVAGVKRVFVRFHGGAFLD